MIATDYLHSPEVASGTKAEALDGILASRGEKLDAVIEMKVEDEELVKRISGRFTCATCGKGYHDSFARPKRDGICDVCGGTEFTRRADDNEKTVRDRLNVYYKQTAPLVSYYARRGNLHSVNGMADIKKVTAEIGRVLDGMRG